MLEDALRESVSIAAEREELLAQHVEFSEEAGRSIRELETDVDRLTMEKGITNIKNSFLILSLAERDTSLASLKSMKKRNMEELMNIKCVFFLRYSIETIVAFHYNYLLCCTQHSLERSIFCD